MEWTVELLMIWYIMTLIWRNCNRISLLNSNENLICSPEVQLKLTGWQERTQIPMLRFQWQEAPKIKMIKGQGQETHYEQGNC